MHASVLRRAILGALALFALSLVLAPPVDAARFGVALFGAFNQYAMRDVDKQIGHLGDEGTSVDVLIERTGWPSEKMAMLLTELELLGKVRRLPGGRYLRTDG
jgi:predicted Rossmann fold nucleotide-binding protein DprA/Smf involved in DNA uptake